MVQQVINGKYMDKRLQENGTSEYWKNVLHTCPVCEEPLKGGLSRATHVATHSPEDFGLSPMDNDE